MCLVIFEEESSRNVPNRAFPFLMSHSMPVSAWPGFSLLVLFIPIRVPLTQGIEFTHSFITCLPIYFCLDSESPLAAWSRALRSPQTLGGNPWTHSHGNAVRDCVRGRTFNHCLLLTPILKSTVICGALHLPKWRRSVLVIRKIIWYGQCFCTVRHLNIKIAKWAGVII